jgi:hypothetical protein
MVMVGPSKKLKPQMNIDEHGYEEECGFKKAKKKPQMTQLKTRKREPDSRYLQSYAFLEQKFNPQISQIQKMGPLRLKPLFAKPQA